MGWLSASNLQVLDGYSVLDGVRTEDNQESAATAWEFAQSGPDSMKQCNNLSVALGPVLLALCIPLVDLGAVVC